MALDWNNPDPNNHEFWDEIANAFFTRRIPLHAFPSGTVTFDASRNAPCCRENTFDAVYAILKASAYSYADDQMWMNADGTKMMWRDVVAAAPLIAQVPCLGMSVKDSFLVNWMKDCAAALKCFRYKFGTVDGYGTDTEGHYQGGSNLASATISGAIAQNWAEEYIVHETGAGGGGSTVHALKRPGDYRPEEYANKWIVHGYLVGRIRAVAPCPWAVPASMALNVQKPVWENGDPWVADANLFDDMGTGWIEGWNTFATPDTIRQILNSFPSTPPAPSASVGGETSVKIGWRVGYGDSALYDYGDALLWTLSF